MARKQAGCLNMALGCFGFILLGGFILAGSIGFIAESSRKNDIAEKQFNQQNPLGTMPRLQHDLRNGCTIEKSGGILELTIDTSGTFARASIQHKLTDALKQIQKSGIDYDSVRVSAVAPLVDKFGNQHQGEILSASYERHTVDQINFKNFVAWDVFEIADYKRLHPEIQAD